HSRGFRRGDREAERPPRGRDQQRRPRLLGRHPALGLGGGGRDRRPGARLAREEPSVAGGEEEDDEAEAAEAEGEGKPSRTLARHGNAWFVVPEDGGDEYRTDEMSVANPYLVNVVETDLRTPD